MTSSQKSKNGGTWRVLAIGLLVAAVAVAILYYIGWFDNRTHIDTPAGDNVEADYKLDDPASPAEVEWQNADGQSLDQVITEPEAETATPPSAE